MVWWWLWGLGGCLGWFRVVWLWFRVVWLCFWCGIVWFGGGLVMV